MAAELNKYVQLLQPSTRNDIRAGTKCQVTGWGATNPELLSPSDTLREVTVTVISRKVCNSEAYYNHHPIITKSMVCAGNARGQKDSCQVRAGHSKMHLRTPFCRQSAPCSLVPRVRGTENTQPQLLGWARPHSCPAPLGSQLPVLVNREGTPNTQHVPVRCV